MSEYIVVKPAYGKELLSEKEVLQHYLDLCPRPKRKVVKEFKGFLMLSAHGNIVGFVDDVNHIWKGFRAAPFTGTYEVEE